MEWISVILRKAYDLISPKSDEEAIDEWLSDRKDRLRFEKAVNQVINTAEPVEVEINGKLVTISI